MGEYVSVVFVSVGVCTICFTQVLFVYYTDIYNIYLYTQMFLYIYIRMYISFRLFHQVGKDSPRLYNFQNWEVGYIF